MDLLTSDLWTALSVGQYDLANQLIYHGANVNEPRKTDDEPVTTLLHYAADTGDIQCIHLLINHGANCNARDSQEQTPLHWAVNTSDRHDVVEVLINGGAVVDARDVNEQTPLHLAVQNSFIESAQKLISRGASTEAADIQSMTMLHMVCYENLSMVKMLINHGANIDAKDIDGCTALRRAVQQDDSFNMDGIQLLLENGADVNTKCRRGYFPLFAAVLKPRELYLLLKWHARVNEATNTGETALHNACKLAEAEAVDLLLKFGADLNARNDEGKTPFELLPNEPSTEDTAGVIIREAVKREALGLPLCEGYYQMAQSCESYLEFDRECREELVRMQSKKIDIEDDAMSFFYIFSMSVQKLAELARNKNFVTAFETSDYLASFRIYAGELTRKFEEAKSAQISS